MKKRSCFFQIQGIFIVLYINTPPLFLIFLITCWIPVKKSKFSTFTGFFPAMGCTQNETEQLDLIPEYSTTSLSDHLLQHLYPQRKQWETRWTTWWLPNKETPKDLHIHGIFQLELPMGCKTLFNVVFGPRISLGAVVTWVAHSTFWKVQRLLFICLVQGFWVFTP